MLLTIEQLKNKLNDKQILIIGNSKISCNIEYNNYEYIVCMNEIFNKEVCNISNIYVCSLKNKLRQENSFKQLNKKQILLRLNNKDLSEKLKNISDYYVDDYTMYKSFLDTHKSKPSTGFLSIYFFLEILNCKNVTIIGFSKNKNDIFYKWHNKDIENNLIKKYIDNNILIDLNNQFYMSLINE